MLQLSPDGDGQFVIDFGGQFFPDMDAALHEVAFFPEKVLSLSVVADGRITKGEPYFGLPGIFFIRGIAVAYIASGDGFVAGVVTGDVELSGGCGVGVYIAVAIMPFHPGDKEPAELEVPQTGKVCGVDPCQKIVAGDIVTALKIQFAVTDGQYQIEFVLLKRIDEIDSAAIGFVAEHRLKVRSPNSSSTLSFAP